MDNHAVFFRSTTPGGVSCLSEAQPAPEKDRGRRIVLAPPDNTARLLVWIDEARAATWLVERNVLGLLALFGLAVLVAIRIGLIAP